MFVHRMIDALGWAEALLGERGVPEEGFGFTNQHVGMAVAIQVDELEVGVRHGTVEARRERAEGLPTFIPVMLEEARHRTV